MSLWDNIRDLGFGAVGVAGEALQAVSTARLSKAETEGPESTPGGSQADSAVSNPVPTQKPTDDPKSLFWDPYAIIEQLGYKDKPSSITYGTLRAMVWRCSIIQAVIQTRVNQVASFSRPQHDRYQLGYRLKLRDSEKEPTPQDHKWMAQMETLLERTGVTDNPRGRDDMETFLRKIAWDSLVYDQLTVEIVPDRKGNPAQWFAVDSSTIRLADSASTHMDEDRTKDTKYVQIYDGMVIAEYNQEEMIFGVRNPRSDIRLFGYGVSELEMLINTITGILYAWEYNQSFFSRGSAAKGIINFKGAVPEKQLQQFRRQWYNLISGVSGAWKTPVVNSDELQYISLQQNNRDMEYSAWMDFLIKVACSMYSMDPVEVNFKYGNTGQKGGLQEASNKEKITESKERGLRPLLRFIARQINQNIIWPINENFEFDFVGLDAKTQDELAELNKKRVSTSMTVDEIRAEDDKPPLPDGKGECILDPNWMQFSQGIDNPVGMGEEGGFGEDEDGGFGGDDEDGGQDETKEGETDFESMLNRYEGKGEKGAKPTKATKPGEKGKSGKPDDEKVEKSLTRNWVVNL